MTVETVESLAFVRRKNTHKVEVIMLDIKQGKKLMKMFVLMRDTIAICGTILHNKTLHVTYKILSRSPLSNSFAQWNTFN